MFVEQPQLPLNSLLTFSFSSVFSPFYQTLGGCLLWLRTSGGSGGGDGIGCAGSGVCVGCGGGVGRWVGRKGSV